jgi:polyhydroxyalkanoate synthesis repressor PhaR
MILIKKYANRKLYDTSNRRYISLPQVAAFVRQGEEVQVIDKDSGQDITDIILKQVILEDDGIWRSFLNTLIQVGASRAAAAADTVTHRTIPQPLTHSDLRELYNQLEGLEARIDALTRAEKKDSAG